MRTTNSNNTIVLYIQSESYNKIGIANIEIWVK